MSAQYAYEPPDYHPDEDDTAGLDVPPADAFDDDAEWYAWFAPEVTA